MRLLYFIFFLWFPFLAYSQNPEKVYGGIVIGVPYTKYNQQVSNLISSGELAAFYYKGLRVAYAVEHYNYKPVYMHISPSISSGTTVNKLMITISPRLESFEYIKDMSLRQAEMGDSKILTHDEVGRYVFSQLKAKYGLPADFITDVLKLENGVEVPVSTFVWLIRSMKIELRHYEGGIFHRVMLVYTMNDSGKSSRF